MTALPLLALLLQTAPKPTIPPTQPATVAPIPVDSPVGHWIADHPNTDTPTLELWWNFLPDGTMTATAGIIVRSHWTLAGDTLTSGPTPTNPKPDVIHIQFKDGKLIGTPAAIPSLTLTFVRVGQPTPDKPPIVGAWTLEHASDAPDPQTLATVNAIRGTLFLYTADGTSEIRISVDVTTGRWSPTTHTYTLPDHPALPFHRTGPDLTLTPPTDSKPHLYHPETLTIPAPVAFPPSAAPPTTQPQ